MTPLNKFIDSLIEKGILSRHPTRNGCYQCVCGSIFKRTNVRSHQDSKRHLKYMQDCPTQPPSLNLEGVETLECAICYTDQPDESFFECTCCHQKHCGLCHSLIRESNPRCPFCRTTFPNPPSVRRRRILPQIVPVPRRSRPQTGPVPPTQRRPTQTRSRVAQPVQIPPIALDDLTESDYESDYDNPEISPELAHGFGFGSPRVAHRTRSNGSAETIWSRIRADHPTVESITSHVRDLQIRGQETYRRLRHVLGAVRQTIREEW
jgi:hypothetical protein